MSKIASTPITWHHFQDMMRQLGYEMLSNSPEHDGVVFKLTGDGPTEGLRNPITVSYPDCVAKDGKTPAYEKNMVIDLLTQIFGGNGDKALFTLIANRHWNG